MARRACEIVLVPLLIIVVVRTFKLDEPSAEEGVPSVVAPDIGHEEQDVHDPWPVSDDNRIVHTKLTIGSYSGRLVNLPIKKCARRFEKLPIYTRRGSVEATRYDRFVPVDAPSLFANAACSACRDCRHSCAYIL